MEWPQAHGIKEIEFPHKSSLQHLTNLHAWGLTTSGRCRACGKTASLKHILTGCEYTLRSYTWRHNEVLEIFAEASKICCETANKALNIINNRAIQFVKEGNISKLAHKNMSKPSLSEGCADWHVTTNLKHNFIFPSEIALMTKHPDIVTWSVKAKKFSLLMVPFEENFNWAHQRKLEKYEDLQEQCVRNGWITNVFPIEVKCRGFIANWTSTFLTNLGLPPSVKRKYMEKIQDQALTASAWIWQSHRVMTIWLSLVVSWDTAGALWASGKWCFSPETMPEPRVIIWWRLCWKQCCCTNISYCMIPTHNNIDTRFSWDA